MTGSISSGRSKPVSARRSLRQTNHKPNALSVIAPAALVIVWAGILNNLFDMGLHD